MKRVPHYVIVFVTSSPAVHHPRHYHLLAAGLTRSGLPVLVVGQRDRRPNAPGETPVYFLPRRERRFVRMLSGPETMIRVARLRPSIIQVNSLDLLPWSVLARKLLRVPVVYDSNDDYEYKMLSKDWLPNWLRLPLSRIVARCEPWLAGHLDATIVATDETATRFQGIRPPVVTVHNFPWQNFANGVPGSAPRYDVTYHGTLPGSYFDLLLATAFRLEEQGVHLRWCLAVNDCRPSEQRALEGRLDRDGVGHRFTLHYNLPYTAIPSLLAQTRTGFIPLPGGKEVQRSLPMKLFEFLAFGCPAVVSDLPAVRRLVSDAGCCILVAPGDVPGYADAVATVTRDAELAHEMGQRGRNLVLDRLHAEAELAPYVSLFRQLLSHG